MCGITGFISAGNLNSDSLTRIVLSMCDAISHRGPDDSGSWVDPQAHVALGHRRLSIVDLSEHGHQPMVSYCGRYVLVFNGEIYNHHLMREELEREGKVAVPWRGHSDTETLLAGFFAWGVVPTLQKTIGMFAIALWDRELRTLTLARDRLGEKPLYYGWQGRGRDATFLFGSELTALRRHPAFMADVNRDSLALYMRYGCIGGENSIYSGIKKLLPGSILTLNSGASEPILRTWWSAADIAVQSVAKPFVGSPEDAVSALENLLSDAIGQQMIADVPLGAFLSGGIDSSTVVALMQARSSRPVKTFSIGFHEEGYNEADHAKTVAQYLGTDHAELYVKPEQALEVIPKLPTLYSEPFADSSQIPTFLVSQLAREHVTVSLSGDAGDELFCGYRRYQMTAGVWSKISRLPRPIRLLAASSIASISPGTLDSLGVALRLTRLGEKLHKGAALLGSRSIDELYRGMVSHWDDPGSVVLGGDETRVLPLLEVQKLQGLTGVERMMALDMISYLPDDILAKVDRAAMGVSLESRVPFLDHRVVEFAWSLPLNHKLRGGVTKWPLRQVLYRHVPRELIERPKMGFGVPLDRWLRGPLHDWAESLLSESRLRSEGFFSPELIRRKWSEHLSGRRNWQHHLWNVLMFQAWLEEQKF